MRSPPTESDLRAWLETRENSERIRKAAKSLFKQLETANKLPVYLGQRRQITESDDDIVQMIQADLYIMLLTPETIRECFANEADIGKCLKMTFMRSVLDEARKSSGDRFSFLYRRVMDALRAEDSFCLIPIYDKKKGNKKWIEGSAYSLSAESRSIGPMSKGDIAGISFPQDIAPVRHYEAIKKKPVLTGLARYFWKEVNHIWKQECPVQVEVRDFVHWLVRHVAMHSEEGSEKNIEDFLPIIPDPENSNPFYNPEIICGWAENFSNQLDQIKKDIFFLRRCLELGIEAVAKIVGKRSTGSISYQWDLIEEKLRFFLRDLPGLNYDDLDQEAFSLFFETLCEILKKTAPAPYQ